VHPEPIAILARSVLAGVFMAWLYGATGCARLRAAARPRAPRMLDTRVRPGAHALPVAGRGSVFGTSLLVHPAVASVSLAIDAVDVVRSLLGTASC